MRHTRTPKIFPDPDSLSAAIAQRFVDLATATISKRGRFCVSLSGGSTPKRLYQTLASPRFVDRIDWPRVDLFFGDERCVARDHPDSNFRMVQETLFSDQTARAARIFGVPVELAPEKAAAAYAEMVQRVVPQVNNLPQFDLLLLGVGADGHTASLFPGTDAIDVRDRVAVAVYAEAKQNWRISLTFPTLNNSSHTLVLLEGAQKAVIVAHLCSDAPTAGWPIERITPRDEVEWYMDAAAARLYLAPKK